MDSRGSTAPSFSSAEEIIAAVTAIYGSLRRRSRRRPTKAASASRVTRGRSCRCRCGTCATCLDEARWERIFNEKFAYPDYYLVRRQENWSTLARK